MMDNLIFQVNQKDSCSHMRYNFYIPWITIAPYFR
jgi:hypothetical protein